MVLKIECWRRGNHNGELIGSQQVVANVKACQKLCQDTDTPDKCMYFTYNPTSNECELKKGAQNNTIQVTNDASKQFLSGLRRCKNGNFFYIILNYMISNDQ